MDAYDIFKKLTKGLSFKIKVLGVKNDSQHQKTLPVKKEEKIEVNEELIEDDEADLRVKSESESSQGESEYERSEDDLQLVEGIKVGEKIKQKKKKEKSEDLLKKLELEEQNRFRNEHGIKTVGRHVPAALQDFSELVQRYNVSQALVNTVKECGYDEPTPVQRQALPCMFEERQIFACAPTGSGKTAAFLLPILHMLGAPQGGPRALILCPTRELAHQIYREALRLSVSTQLQCSVIRNLKESKVKEREATFRRSDIVISTPNRLCYLLNQDSVNITLDKVRWLIVDEADKLFEGSAEESSDFRQQMEQILAASGSRQRRVAMFSATHTPALAKWTRHHLRGLINITVGHRNAATHMVDQELMFCGNEAGKLLAFRQLVQAGLKPPVLVFVQSKERAKQLFKELLYDGVNVDVIHADRTQAQRDNVVRSFRVGRIWVLICTELMGRGVDFRGVNLVLNYDFPPSAISYIHRVGRAGRAGVRGRALTLFTQDDLANLRSIASVMKQSGCAVPEYMLHMKQSNNTRKKVAKRAPKRDDITTILGKRPDKRKLEDSNEPEKAAKDTPNVTDGKNKKQRRIQNDDLNNRKLQNGDKKQRKLQNGDAKTQNRGKLKKINSGKAAKLNLSGKGKMQKKNNKNRIGQKNAKKSKT